MTLTKLTNKHAIGGALTSIARALNIKRHAIVAGVEGTALTTDITHIYVPEQQTTYGKPADVPDGAVIASIVGDGLLVQGGATYKLTKMPLYLSVESVELLESTPTIYTSVLLTDAWRYGEFVFDGRDLSADVALDVPQGVYIAPVTDPTGASGAWVRNFIPSRALTPQMFGAPDIDEDQCGWGDSVSTELAKKFSDNTVTTDSRTVGTPFKAWAYPTGIADYAVAGSFILGEEGVEPNTQVSSYSDDAQMASYSNRDSVALFSQNNSAPALFSAPASFSVNRAQAVGIADVNVKEGMLAITNSGGIDYVGRITKILGTVVTGDTIEVSGWYIVGGGGTTGTPTSGAILQINIFTKIWGMNSNCIISNEGGANSATGLEIGLICKRAGTGALSVGVDVVRLQGEAFTGFHARSGLLSGYSSESNTAGFLSTSDATGYKCVNPTSVSFETTVGGKSKFKVDASGAITGTYFAYQNATSSTTLSIDSFSTAVTTPGSIISMPSPTGNLGKMLLVSNLSGGDITVNGQIMSTGVGTLYMCDGSAWLRMLKGTA